MIGIARLTGAVTAGSVIGMGMTGERTCLHKAEMEWSSHRNATGKEWSVGNRRWPGQERAKSLDNKKTLTLL